MSWEMVDRPADLITKNGKFARIPISHRPLEQAGLQIARTRAEQQQQEGILFNASSVHVQAIYDSFLSPAHGSIESRPWNALQKTLEHAQYTCKQQSLAATTTPARHQITTEVTEPSLPSPSPPPLLHVSTRRSVPRESSSDSLKFASNPLRENRERYVQGRLERNETLFAKVQSFRKVLNKVYPPPPLVKKSSAKDRSRDPPASLFGDVNEHVIKRVPHASVPPANLGRVQFPCENMKLTKTSREQLMTDVTNNVNVPPLSNSLETKQRCSSVSTNSTVPRSNKRCLSVPSIPTSHTAKKHVNMSSTPPKPNVSAYHDQSNVHWSEASTETPPPLKYNGGLIVVPSAPASRKLETNDPESCGGFAYDHDSMPKIIAVHSVTWKESKTERSQSKGVSLAQYHSEKATIRRQRDGSEDRFNQSCFDADLDTTVANRRYPKKCSPVSTQRQADAEGKKFKLSRHVTTGKGAQSTDRSPQQKHSRNSGCQMVNLTPASPQPSQPMARQKFIDLTSFCSREFLSRYGHARVEQASKRHHQCITSDNYAHANIAWLKNCQPHNVSSESLQVLSRTRQQASLKSTSTSVEQTVQGSLSFENSGQLESTLQGNPNCKPAMDPSPKEMENKNDQEGMITKQSLLNPNSAAAPSHKQTVDTEAASTDKLEELCRKILETRERFDQENIKWKKKILRSLEVVLIKRLRKVERDTGQKADIVVPEERSTIHGKQKEKQERQETKKAEQRKRS